MARGLKKGMTNNPNGRKKGVPNKVTASMRASIEAFVQNKWGEVEECFDRLDDKDKLQFIDRMMRYVLPTLQATTVDATVETANKLGNLNDEQLNQLIDEILAQDENNVNEAVYNGATTGYKS